LSMPNGQFTVLQVGRARLQGLETCRFALTSHFFVPSSVHRRLQDLPVPGEIAGVQE
jgi:hypothetical protein